MSQNQDQLHFERFPSAAAQLREQFAVIEKVSPKDLGHAEDKMPMGHPLYHLLAEPLTRLHDPPLVARRTEVTAFARENQKILMATISALDPGTAVVQIATVKTPIDDLFHIWTEKTILPRKPILIHLLKDLEMVLNAAVVRRIMRIARMVNRGRIQHG